MARRSSKPAGRAKPDSPADQPFGSAAELRQVLEALLERLNRDERLATVLRAARWHQSFEFTDLDLRLDVAPAAGGPKALRWTFERDADWEPKMTLRMTSAVAHDYLSGELNLPIAVARGLIEVEGEAVSRLKYATLMTLLAVPYKSVVARHLIGTKP